MTEKIIKGHKAKIRILVEEYDIFLDETEREVKRSSFIRRFTIEEKEHMPASFLAKVSGAMLAIERLSYVNEDE